MPTVIAVKKMPNPSKPWLGFIRPLIIEEDPTSLPRKVQPGEFPKNDEIFVTGGYDRTNDFAENELFCAHFKDNDQEGEYSDDRWAAFVCRGDGIEELRRDEYFHVIDGELNVSNRTIALPFRPTRLLMIRSVAAEVLYGPFDYDEQTVGETAVNLRLKACSVLPGFSGHDQHNVYKFHLTDFETQIVGPQTVLLAHLHNLAEKDHEIVDYISDEALVKLGNDLLPENERAQKNDLKAYRNALAVLPNDSPKFDAVRRQRLAALIDRLDFWTARSSTFISEFLKTDNGQAQLQDYLNAHRQEVIVAAHKHFNEEIEAKKKILSDEVDALSQQKQRLEKDNLRTQAQVTSERQEQLSQELQLKQSEIQEKEQELKILVENLGIANNVNDLRVEHRVSMKELEKLKVDLHGLEDQVSRLQETRQSTLRQLAESQTTLREKMQDLKPLIDVLNGVLPNVTDASRSIFNAPTRREDQPASGSELVSEVCKSLDAAGRSFRFDEVANFLVSIHQSFITVFAGLPGVGKTSLATYLTEALGMQERLLYLAIARGMTSQRDILGFYNPLTQRYQPAPTKLYEMLQEQKQEAGNFPFWVLLDEANLSPIEHYFSTFLPMCDPDNKSREIRTGDPGEGGSIMVPNTVRFLATINYDDTTEPLSGRLIDRVPIIKIEPPDNADFSSVTPITPQTGLLSQNDLDRLLSPTEPAEFTDDEEAVFAKIVSALRSTHESNQGLPTIISPRKRNAINRYCGAARSLMQEKDGPALRALDYAVSQHILPLLNGNGEQYLNRLIALQAVVHPLDQTKTHLKRIIEVGNNEHKFYRFFC